MFNKGAMPPATPEDANLLPDTELQSIIESHGIRADTTVVVYGPTLPHATRIIWALMYAGVDDTRLLNGGLTAWVAEGYGTESQPTHPTSVDFGDTVPGSPELLVEADEIEGNLDSPNTVLIDIRTFDEYIGDDYHDYITNAGHIPGALFQDWTTWIEGDNTFINFDIISSEWHGLGITEDKSLRFT